MRVRGGKCGYVDKSGKLVIPARFDDADSFSDGLAAVSIDGKYGYIDKAGEMKIPASFDCATAFRNGLGIVYKTDPVTPNPYMNQRLTYVSATGGEPKNR